MNLSLKKKNKSNNGSKSTTSNQTNNPLENILGVFDEVFKNISNGSNGIIYYPCS